MPKIVKKTTFAISTIILQYQKIEKQQHLIFKMLKLDSVWYFCLINNLENESIIKTFFKKITSVLEIYNIQLNYVHQLVPDLETS